MSDSARVGIVLSSGGGRGVYAHTGFLLALERLGIAVAASAGCSAGAVVGGIAASGTDLHRWVETLVRVSSPEFWTPDSLLRFVWEMTVRRGRGYTGLSGTTAAIAFCQRNLTAQTFQECRYPFFAVAISLGLGRKVVFSDGELAPRMMASAAMPVLYRPVLIDGDYFCDGALVELAPVDAICCKQRLDAVIIHHVATRYEGGGALARALRRRWAMAEVLSRVLYHQRPWYLSDDRLALRRCPEGCGTPIVVLEPDLPELRFPLTQGGPAVIEAALAQTVELLRDHVEALTTNPRARLLPPADGEDRPRHGGSVCAPG